MRMTKITNCQQDELESERIKQEFNKDYPCHIYFVCKRPRVTIIPEKSFFNKGLMTLTFAIQKQGSYYERALTGRMDMDCSDLKIVSQYPFSNFQVLRGTEVVISAKSSLYYNMHLQQYNEDMDLEVLYIGQSYGDNGKRTAPERLLQHSTLQKIYSEAIQHNPAHEIWLNLLSFERTMITSMDGTIKNPRSTGNDDSRKAALAMNKFMNNELDEHQIINFTEASLIKYFKPNYNKEYKDKFPHPGHKSYSECYDLDINSVCFEIETDCIGTRLYTTSISPAFTHMASFTMETREKRINMFDALDNSFEVKNLNILIQ